MNSKIEGAGCLRGLRHFRGAKGLMHFRGAKGLRHFRGKTIFRGGGDCPLCPHLKT